MLCRNDIPAQPNTWGNTAVIVAHPGHELMAYRWMELHQPLYFCVTDGSGGAARSRLGSTGRLLEQLGARPGSIFGTYSDRAVYRLLLEQRVDVFVGLARKLATALIEGKVESVAGDAVEGFNPVHDVCRFVIDGAVALVQRETGRVLRNFDFVLDSDPNDCPEPWRTAATWLNLSGDELDRKLDAALGYRELREELEAKLRHYGKAAFGRECLRPVTTRAMIDKFEQELPAYERYGQQRVREGRYHDVVRYRAHVRPVLAAIQEAGGR
jgi:hypothetical protein